MRARKPASHFIRGALITAAAIGALTSTTLAQVGRTIVYGDTTSNIPKFRSWNGSGWSGESSMVDVGGSPRWVVVKACPTRTEMIAAVGDNQNDLNAIVYNGTSWGNLIEADNNLVTDADRPFYLAYEQTSGDALLVYRLGSTSTVYFRTWNGTAWSAQGSTSIPGSGDPKFVKLVPKVGSDEIMLVVLDNKKDISAMVWDGDGFGNKLLMDTSTNVSGSEEFDAAYESVSGRCLIAWAVNGAGPPSYRIWTGADWLSAGSLPDVGGKPHWLRMASDPVSNKIIAMTLDHVSDVSTTVWSGSNWGTVTQFETSTPDTDRRGFDVVFEPDGTRALAMYGRSAQNTPYYRTYDGAGWSAASTGPNISQPPSVVQMLPASSGREILIGIERKNDGALCFLRWTGSTLTGLQVLASDLGGPNGNECFMFAGMGAATTRPRITRWQAVAPQ